MAKIVFYEPSARYPYIFDRYHMPRLGAILLATILKEAGHDTSVFSDAIQPTRMADLLDADLVGISAVTATVPRAYEVADFLRARDVPVVIGGPHVTFMAEEGLHHADYIFRGEAENSIVPLVKAILSGRDLESVPGLSFRQEGKVLNNGPAHPPKDLDSIPDPDFGLVRSIPQVSRKFRPAGIMTSRGCPYNCSFCSVTRMFGKKYRFRSAERVLSELSAMDARGRRVFFCDDHLAANVPRLYELLEGMLTRGLRFSWSAQVRASIARDPKLLRLMRRAGCRTLYLGFESIDPDALLSYNKGQTIQEIEHSIRTVRRSGLRVYGMFVVGADTDTAQTLDATLHFAIENKINTLQVLILTPLPGTPLFAKMRQEKRLLHRDWSQYDAHHLVFTPAKIGADELRAKVARVLTRFYSFRRMLADVARMRFTEARTKLSNRRAHLQAASSWLQAPPCSTHVAGAAPKKTSVSTCAR